MEQKHVFLSAALVLGVGMHLGLGVSIYRKIYHIHEHDKYMHQELMKLVINGKDSDVTFDNFPYFLSEKTRMLLTCAGYAHLTQYHLSKHKWNLTRMSQPILLSGPAAAEFYQESLAKALAHYFGSKLLVLDVNYFHLKMLRTYGCPISSFCFDIKRFLDSLYKVLVYLSETDSVILYIKDVENIFLPSRPMYIWFQRLLNKLPGSVLVLGSRTCDSEDKCIKVDERLTMLFPYNIGIKPPQDKTCLEIWKVQLEEVVKNTQLKDNRNRIAEVLEENDIDCHDFNSIGNNDIMLLSNLIHEILASAIMDNKNPEYRNGKLIISAESLCNILRVFQEGESIKKENEKNEIESWEENPPDNTSEEHIRNEIIPADKIGVTFSDIGALDDVKESLQEEVMLPLRRPDLFKGNGVLKPCKGVLLFGPPGTGKTMLAKAIANEAGATFINVSVSTITDMVFGQSEKNVRAIFSLATKVAPTIIFIDEVDSMLGQRGSNSECNTMRRIKNEFMSHWDGLLSQPDDRVIVLGATNMPFDLDDAVIRRFQRRIMVGLPSAENRETILKTLLANDKHEDIDFKELSTMTEGYSGSDLKNLCATAAYRPIKELIQQDKKSKTNESEGTSYITRDEDKDDQVIPLRPLNMEDMRQAKKKVAVSVGAEGSIMHKLKEWNDLYGEGGSRKKKEQFSYFI